jgi:TM2 domain-containing membrane protein YozV
VELYVNKLKFYNKNPYAYLCVMPTYILSLNAIRKWDLAKKEFISYIDKLPLNSVMKQDALSKIESLYAKKNIPKEYFQNTAVNWSRFIPGAGQIYTGDILEGLFAFSLCSAFVFTAGYSFYYEYYFTGYIIGFGMLYESYKGGMKRVAFLANRKNNDTMNLFNKNCVNLFIKINK